MEIKKMGEFLNEARINHYQVGQTMDVHGLKRKQGDGKQIIVNQPGEIIEIRKWDGGDIAYLVDFDLELEHSSPYGKKYTQPKTQFYVFHNADKEFYTVED